MSPVDTNSQLSVKLDFSHYNIKTSGGVVTLPDQQCSKGSFVVAATASGLIPGRQYTATFELLNPSSNKQVFDPQTLQIFASNIQQQFITVANVDPQYSYILKSTVTQTSTSLAASDIVAATCNTIPVLPTPTPTPSPIPLTSISFDNGPILKVQLPDRCSEELNIIATIHNADIGRTYKYEFLSLTENADITLVPPSGFVSAGFREQNINTILKINNSNNSLSSLQVKIYDAKYLNSILDEDILLIKCYECI